MRFVCSIVLVTMASWPSPASAQTAAPGAPGMSRTHRLIRNTIVGAAAGVVTGGLLWAATRDCGRCGGPGHAMLTTGLFGATAGAWVGVVDGWGAGRHPDIRLNRHVAAAPAVSLTRVGGALKISF